MTGTAESSLWNDLEGRLTPVLADYRGRLADLSIEVKNDRTFLTDADLKVQDLIIETIRDHDPRAVVIAEEDERQEFREEVLTSAGRLWVIDPIDGTAEFIQPGHREFCSVVCLLEDWRPVAALILAPELGREQAPLVVTGDVRAGTIYVNREPEKPQGPANGLLSVTRSAEDEAPAFDEPARRAGYQLKTRTTSQTLDMVRTVVDLSDRTQPTLPSFELFWRRRQKLWDGAAGLCLGAVAGLRSCDERGGKLPFTPEFLSAPTPTFTSTVMGRPEAVEWLLETTPV